MKKIYVKCPSCNELFDSQKYFYWTADEKGHPTVENLRCPSCNAGTEPIFRCEQCPHDGRCKMETMCPCCDSWNYEDFNEVTE